MNETQKKNELVARMIACGKFDKDVAVSIIDEILDCKFRRDVNFQKLLRHTLLDFLDESALDGIMQNYRISLNNERGLITKVLFRKDKISAIMQYICS